MFIFMSLWFCMFIQLLGLIVFFFFKYTATTDIYTDRHTLPLHDALPIWRASGAAFSAALSAIASSAATSTFFRRVRLGFSTTGSASVGLAVGSISASVLGAALRRLRLGFSTTGSAGVSADVASSVGTSDAARSEEHTSELQSLMRISYAVFCLKKKK